MHPTLTAIDTELRALGYTLDGEETGVRTYVHPDDMVTEIHKTVRGKTRKIHHAANKQDVSAIAYRHGLRLVYGENLWSHWQKREDGLRHLALSQTPQPGGGHALVVNFQL